MTEKNSGIPRLCLGIVFSIFTLFLSSSCSNDYRSAIPMGCTAVVRVDASDDAVGKQLSVLKTMLNITNPQECGIDFSKRIYLFSSADGNMGLCAKVDDDDKLYETITRCHTENGPERQGCKFFILNGNIIVGYTSSALLAIGPVISSARGDMYNRMTHLLLQDEESSMLSSPMMDKLDSMEGGVVFVAQADAMPEKLAGVVSFGMPKGTELSQCIVAGHISIVKDILSIEAEPMSFNADTDRAVKASYDIFRPIKGKYLSVMDEEYPMGFFVNVDGRNLLPLMQNSEYMLSFLTGINQAMDFNAVIKSIDGDMFLAIPGYTSERMELSMAAQLSGSEFLSDVAYWKESVPAGAHIIDWKKNAYCYSGGGMTFCFGVTPEEKPQFYSGTSCVLAERSVVPAQRSISENIKNIIRGKRVAFVVNVQPLFCGQPSGDTMKIPVLGTLQSIVYTVK